ncbi:hypothetical protein DFP94_10747 [Fontibacillus phaseoli]|uniref:Uncharacterized protein n=1 Tax=Fontibacillus phaseoli TaxID=1416533 RepID=A0A369BEJ7_9BACL|nr:hypothetical protein DFP94_10747 [Fontibacillus phaseoli]
MDEWRPSCWTFSNEGCRSKLRGDRLGILRFRAWALLDKFNEPLLIGLNPIVHWIYPLELLLRIFTGGDELIEVRRGQIYFSKRFDNHTVGI